MVDWLLEGLKQGFSLGLQLLHLGLQGSVLGLFLLAFSYHLKLLLSDLLELCPCGLQLEALAFSLGDLRFHYLVFFS